MSIVPEIEARRARRALSDEALPRQAIGEILLAATLAPSCFNNQPWRIVAIDKASHPEAWASVAAALTPGNAWATKAPLFVAFTTAFHLDCRLDAGREYAFFDLGQAALAMQIQATLNGWYAHPMAGFSAAKLSAAIGLPPDHVVLCLVAVGKPGEPDLLSERQRTQETAPRSRVPLGDRVFDGSYGKPWS